MQGDKCKLMSNEKGAKSHVLFKGVMVLIFTGRRSTDRGEREPQGKFFMMWALNTFFLRF